MSVIATVAIDGAAGSFDKLYSYVVPEPLRLSAKVGTRVVIPFGKNNSKRQGMIFFLTTRDDSNGIKDIIEVCDKEPALSAEMLKLCIYMRDHYFCTYYDAVHALLPIGLNYKLKDFYSANPDFLSYDILSDEENELFSYIKASGEIQYSKLQKAFTDPDNLLLSLTEKQALLHNMQSVRNMQDMKKRYIRALDDNGTKLTPRQKEVYEVLCSIGSCSVKELQYFTGASMGVISALCDKSFAEFYDKQEFRIPFKSSNSINKKEIVLTDEQTLAFNGLLTDFGSNKGVTSLLYGITGSGKTQVYLKLVDVALESGKGVIIMVPEIALTPQMIKIFSDRYGSNIAVFHSGLSLGQRMDEYNRIKLGHAKIAIGTRSAVFAPFDDIGLIIMDEEQEHTYKSEKTPRFHAREVARFRSAYHNCLLCLSSATPSLESYSRAMGGHYKLYTLKNRYGNAVLPTVETVDMREELTAGNTSDISRMLADGIEQGLKEKKQSIILLNRRGHNTYVSCTDCGHVFECPDCSISLTYHKANNRLMCHYCGRSLPVPAKCTECGSERIRYSGCGTQHLEEQIKMIFPTARVLRLDADSTLSRDSYSVNLGAFANGDYDILIGTQMVAKGLDFPNVTLVGIIGADRTMNSVDYRSFERCYSLLTQVIGRAGRSGLKGRAIVQTNDPLSHMIELAKKQDYESFYNEEILMRKMMVYPPFCDICLVFTQSADNRLAKSSVETVFENIKEQIDGDYADVKAIILGPCAASVPKVGGKYRFRLIIKCKNNSRFREMIKKATDIKRVRDLGIGIDINPETII